MNELYLILGHRLRGMSQGVRHLEQVLAEALDAEDLGVADLLVQSVAHVFAVGEGPLVLVEELGVLFFGGGQLLGELLHFWRGCGRLLLRRSCRRLLGLLFCAVQALVGQTKGAVEGGMLELRAVADKRAPSLRHRKEEAMAPDLPHVLGRDR